MKKLTIILITSLLSINLIATNYYVKNDGNNTLDGRSDATAWQTLSYVRGKTFSPGDTIFFKRGHIWKEYMAATNSGTAGSPIVYTAYGTGIKPIFTCKDTITGWSRDANWTETTSGSNVWYKTLAYRPYRLWINSTEAKRAYNESSLSATLLWSWNADGTNRLYVYSVGNPGSKAEPIEMGYKPDSPSKTITFSVSTANYITISYLDLQGGSYSLRVANSSYITVDSCNIGYDGAYAGLRVYASSTSLYSDSGSVNRCNFDSNFKINYGDMSYIDYDNEGDGLKLINNVRYWDIDSCYFKNWRHSSYAFEALTEGYVCQYNKIHDCYFTAPDIDDGRGFSGAGNQTTVIGNEIYNNIVYHTHSSNQVSAYGSKIYNNIFAEIHNAQCRLLTGTRVGIGLVISNSGNGAGASVGQRMNVFNNTFINTEDYGMRVNAYTGENKNDTICNNIFYNCNSYNNYAIAVFNESAVSYYVWKNNLIYNESTDDVISYRGTGMTVTEWNAADTNGDVIADNISSNPQFLDEVALDYHLKNTSPAIGAGITTLTSTDKDNVTWDSPPAIGAYEYTSYATPVLPTISTGSVIFRVKNMATISASNCIDAGGGTVTDKGICWSISPNPTISDSKTTDGSGEGTYNSTMTGLTAGKVYYVRAYATNAKGTNYGTNISFKVIPFQIGIY